MLALMPRVVRKALRSFGPANNPSGERADRPCFVHNPLAAPDAREHGRTAEAMYMAQYCTPLGGVQITITQF